MRWYPIEPTLTPKKKLAAFTLAGEKGEQEVAPQPLGKQQPFQQLEVSQETYSGALATKLGLVVAGSANAAISWLALVYEAMAFSEVIEEGPIHNTVAGTRWGAGLRLTLKVFDVHSDLKLDIGFVAAQAQLNRVKADYKMSLIGITDASMFKLIPGPGTFDFKSYSRIVTATERVLDFMGTAASKAKLKAVPIAVLLSKPPVAEPLDDARNIVFAMRQIGEGTPLEEAKKISASKGFGTDTVEAVYRQYARSSSTPTKDERNRAKRWLEAEHANDV
jgi:hypothetical protein